MPDPTLDALRRDADALMSELSRALHRAHAGLAPSAELRPIYARHARLLDAEALALVREAADAAPGRLVGGDADGAPDGAGDGDPRALLEWLVETQAGRATAALEERELAWERGARVRLADGTGLEYGRVPIALANARERGERLALDAARAALVGAELAPLRRERLARERDFVEEATGRRYADAFAWLTGIDLAALADAGDALLRDTQAMWDDVLPAFARRRLALPVAELTRADALALFRAPEFDAAFPAGAMLAQVRTQVASMGVDPAAGGRIRYDVGEREGKRARAFCAPVRVPDEVHLVLRPQGGAGDWRTLLHELGHALHFAHARADLPFEARWAGDHSVTEGFAMLLDHLLHDRGWLLRYTALDRARADDFLRSAAFEELHFLRRYAAKLRYELALHGGEVPERELPALYADLLGRATSVRYRPEDALVDVDPRFYAARYLRAWQLQAVLAGALRERYDEDWWRNPRTGAWLTGELMGAGQRDPADRLAARVAAGAPLGFAPVVRAIEARLV